MTFIRNNRLYVGLLLLGAGLVAASLIPLYLAKETNRVPGLGIDEIADTVGTYIAEGFAPEGQLLLSLVPKNSLDKRLEGYAFDLATGTLAPTEGAFGAASLNGTHRAFVADGAVFVDGVRVSAGEYTSLRLPSVNNTGNVLFAALGEEAAEGAGGKLSLDDWRVYLIDEDGEREIGAGQYPKWIGDEAFIYATKEGIYRQKVNGEATLAIPFIGFYGVNNMKMAASADGVLVALSTPDVGEVTVYRLATGEAIRTFDVTAFWLAFSPDNEYLAMQAIDSASPIENPQPRVEIYSLEHRTLQYTVDLDSFIQTSMFLTDWMR